MSRTRFCDSSGLHILLRAHQRAIAEGGELRLVLPGDGPIPRIVTLMCLDQLIPSFASLAEALAHTPDGTWVNARTDPGIRSRKPDRYAR